jgi:hypothetical protein
MKKLTLGTLLAALAASAILAAPGGAAKQKYSITCNAGTLGTTLTWGSGTTGYSGDWRNSSNTVIAFFSTDQPLGNSPGSTSFDTAQNAVTAEVTFMGRNVGAKLAPATCTP